ncbi:MAG: tetratricopeptide repeat protein [Gammaproteobacteria bacterium]|nr:tetratricopeptide repeat protein [Gammaproteobacteria bacterium]
MAYNTTQHHSNYVSIMALVALLSITSGCGSGTDDVVLPEPPALVLEGFDTDVATQIDKTYEQWKANPRAPETNGNLAMLLHAHQQYSWATVYYQRARQLASGEFRWAYLHGLVLIQLGEREAAIAALCQALELTPNYMPARVKLAMLLIDSGQFAEGQSLYEQLLKEWPDLPQALYGLGRLKLQQGQDSGIALLERATYGAAPYGAAHYALAEAYRSIGNSTQADMQFELFRRRRNQEPLLGDPFLETVKDMNESKLGLINRGQRLLGQGKIRNAIEQFERALDKDSSAAGTHSVLISAYGMLGEYDQAEAHYRKGLAIDPDPVRLHNNFGVLRLKQQKHADAAQAFRAAIAADPDYVDAYINLGAALESSGKGSEAIKYYRKALEHDSAHRAAGFHLGNAYMRMNNPYRAAEQYQRILEPQDRSTPEYLQALAAAYLGMWKYAEAEAALENAIEIAEKTARTDLLSKLKGSLERVQSKRQSLTTESP